MKLTDLTQEQLEAAYVELIIARSGLASRGYGDLGDYYLDRAALLEPVIRVLRNTVRTLEGASDGI